MAILLLLLLLVAVLYFWVGFASGRTIGCRLTGLSVIDPRTGGAPGALRGVVRAVAFSAQLALLPVMAALLFTILPLTWGGFRSLLAFGESLFLLVSANLLWLLSDARNQTWYDKLSGTVVVRTIPVGKPSDQFGREMQSS